MDYTFEINNDFPYHLGELDGLDVKSEQVDGKRFYTTPTGEKYPSVTTVTGLLTRDHIKLWRKRVGEETANKISTQAAKRGTKMHDLFETYLRAEEDIEFDNVLQQSMFNAVQPYLDEIVPIALECPLWSHNLQMAGRVDCLGIVDDVLTIVDFKTSSKYKEEHMAKPWYTQMTAYAIMVEELTGAPVEQIIAVVAVEGGGVQIFGSDPLNHVEELNQLRNQYRNLYGV